MGGRSKVFSESCFLINSLKSVSHKEALGWQKFGSLYLSVFSLYLLVIFIILLWIAYLYALHTFIVHILFMFKLPYGSFFLFCFVLFCFVLFCLERGRGREGATKGGKYQCVVASHVHPTGDLACHPGMCPHWGLKGQPFGLQDNAQPTELHQSRPLFFSFHINHIWYLGCQYMFSQR